MLATQVFRSVSSFPVYSAAFFSCLFSSYTSAKRTFRDAISVTKSSSLSILASNLVILAEASQQGPETQTSSIYAEYTFLRCLKSTEFTYL